MSYGICDVSIPDDHHLGELDSPPFWRLPDPSKDIVLVNVGRTTSKETFLKYAALKASASKKKEALVFVHGYTVTFEDAARRAAQMKYDLQFQGPVMFFSWPTHGGIAGYTADGQNMAWATPHLREFLEDVATGVGVEKVHVIAHSMGNRGVTAALSEIAEADNDVLHAKFREIILAAPDIDSGIFIRDILPSLRKLKPRITLYASENDKALSMSGSLHRNPRAGEGGDFLVVEKGVDTVDASAVDTSFLGHGYYSESDAVMSDIFHVLQPGYAIKDRFRLETVNVETEDGTKREYWRLKK